MRTATRMLARSGAATLALVLAACAGDSRSVDSPTHVTVRVIAFNDFHGYIDPPAPLSIADPQDASRKINPSTGGAAYLASAIRRLKADHPLNVVVGAGDMVGASPLDSGLFHDEPTIQALSAAGLEFTSVGNHEFDRGLEELQRKQAGGCFPNGVAGKDTCLIDGRFDGAGFQYLAANVIDRRSNKPIFPAYAIKSFDVGGGRHVGIAFVGLVLRETPGIVAASATENLRFDDEADTVNALLPEIRSKGVSTVVVLIHQGITTTAFNDTAQCEGASGGLLTILPRLDSSIRVVISGHTHWPYICDHGQGTAGASTVFYTSAFRYGSMLTSLDLNLDASSGALDSVSAVNHLVINDRADNPVAAIEPSLSADPQVAGIVARYDQAVAPLVNRVIGSITADIVADGDHPSGETPLGDLVADAQLQAAQNDPHPPVVAFMNPGGIRNDLHYAQISGGERPGEITYGEAYDVQPFGNLLVDMDLSGDELYTILGQQWRSRGPARILQVSQGLSYTWDASAANGVGQIVDGSLAIKGVAVVRSQIYRVAANDFIASGSDGFSGFKAGKNRYTGVSDVEALSAYITRYSPISPKDGNRIKRLH